jgi:L-fuconate dehydratase
MTRITIARTLDIRAPTSITLAGSDAVHQDPDYSGAYVFIGTDGPHEGVGMTFTVGRNDLCCAAIEQLAPLVVGRPRGARRRRCCVLAPAHERRPAPVARA